MKVEVIAYYSTFTLEYEKVILEVDDMNKVWEIAQKNEKRLPSGRLVKIELVPKHN